MTESGGRDTFLADLDARLMRREQEGLFRVPRVVQGTDFTSNDYLGLAQDSDFAATVAESVKREGTGLTGSRLLSGERRLTADAEATLAQFCGQPSAVIFSSGYAANVGLMSALVGPNDHVVSDTLNHASLIDGMRLSGARKYRFAHGSLEDLARTLANLPSDGRRLVVVESVYSMDGDLTDIEAVCDLADRFDAAVVVDEAHATGLYGRRLSGRVEALKLSDRVLATVHTGGKALGCGGAWVAGPGTVAQQIHNHARSFIYSTAPIPALVASLVASVARLPALVDRVEQLHHRAHLLRSRLVAAGYDIGRSGGCIVPIIVGGTQRSLTLAASLVDAGFNVRAIRPPTVPAGTSRIRLAVGTHLSDDDIEGLVQAVRQFDAAPDPPQGAAP